MSKLLDSAEFRADLVDVGLSIREVARKWGKSYGFVQKYRKRASVNPEFTVPAVSERVAEGSVDPVKGDSVSLGADEAWGQEDWEVWLRSKGTDPGSVSFSWGVTTNPAGGFWNKLYNVKVKPGLGSAEDLYSLSEAWNVASRLIHSEQVPVSRVRRADVVVLADFQIGKTGRRGGTPELIARIEGVRGRVVQRLSEQDAPERIALLDLGDMIEGFESGGNPMRTNDLSLPDQLDLYACVLLDFVRDLTVFAPVDVAVVCSNHAAWRRGKQNLGIPADDFGIFVHKQVEKMCRLAGLDVTFHFPDDYDESMCLDVLGTPVGLVHGNQFGPGQAIAWWEKQAFGSQAVSRADVMLSGHYHSFGAGVAGVNPFTGRERMWLGAPTLDSGSDYFRATAGRDSNPGLMLFSVTGDGFDLGSLRLV